MTAPFSKKSADSQGACHREGRKKKETEEWLAVKFSIGATKPTERRQQQRRLRVAAAQKMEACYFLERNLSSSWGHAVRIESSGRIMEASGGKWREMEGFGEFTRLLTSHRTFS